MRENIAYGRHHATEAQIISAAQLANADEFIVRTPGGYDAPILILDEPTASLDNESEQLVMDGLDLSRSIQLTGADLAWRVR